MQRVRRTRRNAYTNTLLLIAAILSPAFQCDRDYHLADLQCLGSDGGGEKCDFAKFVHAPDDLFVREGCAEPRQVGRISVQEDVGLVPLLITKSKHSRSVFIKLGVVNNSEAIIGLKPGCLKFIPTNELSSTTQVSESEELQVKIGEFRNATREEDLPLVAPHVGYRLLDAIVQIKPDEAAVLEGWLVLPERESLRTVNIRFSVSKRLKTFTWIARLRFPG